MTKGRCRGTTAAKELQRSSRQSPNGFDAPRSLAAAQRANLAPAAQRANLAPKNQVRGSEGP